MSALYLGLGLTHHVPLSGLDSYILNAKPAELGTGIGLKLRAALGMMRELTSEAGRLAAPTDAAAPSKQS